MSKICPKCNKEWPDEFVACPLDGSTLVDKKQHAGVSLNLGDANAISGGIHVSDSHNISNIDQRVINTSNVHNITNNVTQYAARSEMEILQEKKSIFLEECKKAYDDNVLDPSELVALESCRLRLGLDKDEANRILESVKQLSINRNRSAELSSIAKIKLNRLSESLQRNEVSALVQQITGFDSLVTTYTNEELQYKYWLILAALKHEYCIERFESIHIDSYWMFFFTYFAYLKKGDKARAGDILYTMSDRFPSMPDSNIAIMATIGSILQNDKNTALEYIQNINDDYSPVLKELTHAAFFVIEPNLFPELEHEKQDFMFFTVNLLQPVIIARPIGKESPIKGILKTIYDNQENRYTKMLLMDNIVFLPDYQERVRQLSDDIAKKVYQNCLHAGMSGDKIMAKKAVVHIIQKKGAPIGVEQNPAMLDTLFMKFADKYDLHDLIVYIASQLYYLHLPIPNARKEASKWLEFGCKKGNAMCAIALATQDLLHGKVDDCLKVLSHYARQGNIYSVDWLINIYKYADDNNSDKAASILASLEVETLKELYANKALLSDIRNFYKH